MARHARGSSTAVGYVALVGLVAGLAALSVWQGETVAAAVAVLLVVGAWTTSYQQRNRSFQLRQAVAYALEQASVEHEQQRCVFEALEQGVCLLALDGQVLLLNDAGERLLGYYAAELTDLFRSGEWHEWTEDGELIPDEERPITITSRTGEPVRDRVLVWHTKAGHPITVRVATQPVRDVDAAVTRVVIAFSDVTAERAIERQVEFTQARFEALVEQSTDLICVIDGTGSLVYASPAAERLLGHNDVAFLGHPFAEFLHPDDIPVVSEAYQRLLGTPGGVEFVETRVSTVTGEWRLMEIAATNRLDDPAVCGVVANCRDVTERAEAAARLAWQAFHDPLTGLPNRALLLDRLGNALDRSKRSPRITALMFIDLDDFKDVNDTLGHEAGDQLLCEVGRRLSSLVRAGDTVARLGGDEFIVLADGLEAAGEAAAIAQRINNLLANPIIVRGTELSVTASIGIAFDSDHEPDRLLREADNALYRAKAAGKSRFEVYVDQPVAVAKHAAGKPVADVHA